MLPIIQVLFKRRTAVAGVLAVGAALAISSFGAVRAQLTPDATATTAPKTKTCKSAMVCQTFTNTGPALSVNTTNTKTRALIVTASSTGAFGADVLGEYIGIIGRAPNGTAFFPLVLADPKGNNLDYTDGQGNIFYSGALRPFTSTSQGQKVVAYAPQSATRTMEDVGSARLVNGQATVVLDRTFAQTIDTQTPYHVFLTPDGDTRGLYVATKTPTAFVVRETQGGRGTLLFDYRIVATAFGHASERMGITPVPPGPDTASIR